MPITKLQERARKKYITVDKFREQFDLSSAQAYRIISMPEMAEAVIKIGTKGKRIDIDRAFEIMQQIFR